MLTARRGVSFRRGVDAASLLFSRFPGAQDVRGTSALRRPKRSGDRRTGSNPVYSTKSSLTIASFLYKSTYQEGAPG